MYGGTVSEHAPEKNDVARRENILHLHERKVEDNLYCALVQTTQCMVGRLDLREGWPWIAGQGLGRNYFPQESLQGRPPAAHRSL